jgi:hypothetical protein
MHIHNVYFWLMNDLNDEAFNAFEQGLEALTRDPVVKSDYFGKPANTPRVHFGIVLYLFKTL